MKQAVPEHVVNKIQEMTGIRSAKRIADMFGISVSTVYNIVHRERKKRVEKKRADCIHFQKYGNLRPLTKEELMGGRASPYAR